jgi:hypothetical protein
MRLVAVFAAFVALAACAATLPQVIVTGGGTFEVRYDATAHTTAQADAKANEYCGGAATFVSSETRFDGFAYRTYRCAGS